MSVYKEGFMYIQMLQAEEAKYGGGGIPTKKGDNVWNAVKGLIHFYSGEDEGREIQVTDRKTMVKKCITLIDEWAVSDERKTVKQATEVYEIGYYTGPDIKEAPIYKGYDGLFTVTRIQ
jgi:hypothetical protein